MIFHSERNPGKSPNYGRHKLLKGCPRKNGQGKFRTFTDFPNILSESRPLYPMNKYHICLDQIFYIYFLRGGFHCKLKKLHLIYKVYRIIWQKNNTTSCLQVRHRHLNTKSNFALRLNVKSYVIFACQINSGP